MYNKLGRHKAKILSEMYVASFKPSMTSFIDQYY